MGDQLMNRKVSRKWLPQGRPQEYQPNIVQPAAENGISVNAGMASQGHLILGHCQDMRPIIDFGLTEGRTHTHYLQGERIKNVMRDNERLYSDTDGGSTNHLMSRTAT
jgi:hypothetical protein